MNRFEHVQTFMYDHLPQFFALNFELTIQITFVIKLKYLSDRRPRQKLSSGALQNRPKYVQRCPPYCRHIVQKIIGIKKYVM